MVVYSLTTELLLKKPFKPSRSTPPNILCNEKFKVESFYIYIRRLCSATRSTPECVIKKSNLTVDNGYKFFNGFKCPSREQVIQLAFGFGLNYAETQRLLMIAQKNILCSSIERDAAIIFALGKKLSIAEAYEMFNELSLPVLGVEDYFE